MVVNELCERQAQPAEEARLAKPLDHDHHARDEEDGGPVDARRALLTGSVPEVRREERAEIERLPDRRGRVHTNAEDENKYQRSADERNDMALELIEDDQKEHPEKNTDRNDLRKHSKGPHFQDASEGIIRLPRRSRNRKSTRFCVRKLRKPLYLLIFR